MKILLIGSPGSQEEAKQKFGNGHDYTLAHSQKDFVEPLNSQDVIFDFVSDSNHMEAYYKVTIPVFVNTAFNTLKNLTSGNGQKSIFGFCGLPSLFNRALLEVCIQKENHRKLLEKICSDLSTDFKVVADHIGMVTPRVVCMIINEAYCTVEDGTANREDIDLAMKLGTNYPFGPFEWCEKIGAKNVVNLLDSVYWETRDNRYTVCDLLRQE